MVVQFEENIDVTLIMGLDGFWIDIKLIICNANNKNIAKEKYYKQGNWWESEIISYNITKYDVLQIGTAEFISYC